MVLLGQSRTAKPRHLPVTHQFVLVKKLYDQCPQRYQVERFLRMGNHSVFLSVLAFSDRLSASSILISLLHTDPNLFSP